MSNPTNPDLAIARAATMDPISEVAANLGIEPGDLIPYGHTKAKLSSDCLRALSDRPDGKLILVTAITPTPAGEGKTTTSVGLHDGLCRIGKKSIVCLREPSLGPCFGMKGGAAGGGHAQVVPMEDINLHFTGDLHAITAAHNLLSAMIDNHLHWGNELKIDTRRVAWPRVVDLNDRALRDVIVGLGGTTGGYSRETRFDITVASEIMAILCLAEDANDLARRLDRIVVAHTRKGKAITAADLKATGAMAVLLKDAILPNLVQTLENNPAFIHGGPFANIAHGCSSVAATKAALKLGDYVVTEAGFGADLGAEKFFDIKCRKAGLDPNAVVLVATIRALKHHGGAESETLGSENVDAVRAGCANLERHLRNLQKFGVPVVVAINGFVSDTEAEIAAVVEVASGFGVDVVPCTHWSDGGAGTEALAHKVAELAEQGSAEFSPLYPDEMPLWEKIETVAKTIYGAAEVVADRQVTKRIGILQKKHGHLPVCMAKTPASFSTDPSLRGAPVGHTVAVREVRLSAGAGFIVVVCGDLMTMPGLPRVPAAETIGLDADGQIQGLS